MSPIAIGSPILSDDVNIWGLPAGVFVVALAFGVMLAGVWWWGHLVKLEDEPRAGYLWSFERPISLALPVGVALAVVAVILAVVTA